MGRGDARPAPRGSLPAPTPLHPTHRTGTPLARSTRYSSNACVGLTRRSRAPTHSSTGVRTCGTAGGGCPAPCARHPAPSLPLPYPGCLGDGRAQQHGGQILSTGHPLRGVGQPQGGVAPAARRCWWVPWGCSVARQGMGGTALTSRGYRRCPAARAGWRRGCAGHRLGSAQGRGRGGGGR